MSKRTMDDRAASQEGTPMAPDVVMVARLIDGAEVTCEWCPVTGSSDSDDFAQYVGDYLASMAAEGMQASVVVERWSSQRWNDFVNPPTDAGSQTERVS